MHSTIEQVIQSTINAIMVGASLSQIHDALIERGWSEDDIFLFIKAAQIIAQDRIKSYAR